MAQISNTERIARGLLRHYLPNERMVFNIRPSFAVNPETGNALEFDIAIERLALLIEVNGSQHYRFTPGLQETYADYEKQLRHDTIKMQAATAAGYQFVPLSIHQLVRSKFEPFIKQVMKDHGILEQFQRTAPPLALYAEAERLSRARVVPSAVKRRPYRKPGLWPLLQRAWKRMMKGEYV